MRLSQANPIPPVLMFCSTPELRGMGAIVCLSVSAAGIYSIWFLYLVVKFGFDAPTVGLFFSAVGLVTAIVQGVLLPALIPRHITARTAIPFGLALRSVEYICYGLADTGWQVSKAIDATYEAGLGGIT